MDASVVTTTAAASAGLDPAALVGVLVGLLAVLGAPWWLTLAARLGAALLFGRRGLPGVQVEPAPAPVSDGGTAAERELPPAAPGDGGPGVISDGGTADDLGRPPAQASTGPIDPTGANG